MGEDVEKRIQRTLAGRWYAVFLAIFMAGLLVAGAETQTQQRKVVSKVPPEYPELARRLNIKGIARVEATVAADGKVISIKEIGGNPVLLDALVRAVKKWRYERASKTSVEQVKFEFGP